MTTTLYKEPASFADQYSNINLLWASLFIEELVRNGISDFCIAPGSRSTPLTLAAAGHKEVNTHVHFDERGLGFFALGLSQFSRKPVVIITTSGTAVANLYPAVIEAKQSAIPLIVLSADRPPELLDCGANQAIDQCRIFSHYPVFFAQIPSATTQIKPNYLLTTINQGLQQQKQTPAPIHFNIAFSEPLYPHTATLNYQSYLHPLQEWLTDKQPFSRYFHNEAPFPAATETTLRDKKVVIIVGRVSDLKQAIAIAEFAALNNYPLLADQQSTIAGNANNLHYYDLLLVNDKFTETLQQADIIVQFGDHLISKRLNQFIDEFAGDYLLVDSSNARIDPTHRLRKRFVCSAAQWIKSQQDKTVAIDKHWLQALQKQNFYITEQIISPFLNNNLLSEISVICALDKLLPANNPVFIGNSMPIRLSDMFFRENTALPFSNRGASGIDGLLATASGIAKSCAAVTTLLIGDTSFLYDLNSLALLKQLNGPFVIIVFNNDGGAIFNLLPVPAQQKQDYYQLPHGLTFADSCRQFSIDYYQPADLTQFTADYQRSLHNRLSLIEICVKNDQTYNHLEDIKGQVKHATF
ncbi:MAG: 2-succinyl-5-enolpyruvyl-6-hydroxy-3-cyclohexene-1-carboxylate synthase [Psychromonas sp.]|jgi:2-succinyl-5-enolpyruvyl-6-hydroxy-3-cyclohexene-1-carboxylate synthase|uniref:2-succinyl-5-enolpyruvyl-6-hydroxy-3- cyclohexene-1-carboxylic-acid synthase n=1 Tax=Psychromonas sp. TaxID=1884585 RepID=UPI0039E4452F